MWTRSACGGDRRALDAERGRPRAWDVARGGSGVGGRQATLEAPAAPARSTIVDRACRSVVDLCVTRNWGSWSATKVRRSLRSGGGGWGVVEGSFFIMFFVFCTCAVRMR